MSWIDALTPEERRDWDAFVEHFRRDALKKIGDSDAFVSLVAAGEFDVQAAAELGTAVLLSKPIIALAMPGRDVPPGLRRIAHRTVFADPDTEEGREKILRALEGIA